MREFMNPFQAMLPSTGRAARNRLGRLLTSVLALLVCALFPFASSLGSDRPQETDPHGGDQPIKLVLMLVVDQLRADTVCLLQDRFCEGGIRYLMDQGLWYRNAQYEHATTLTSSGHARLFTGADARDHGVAGNYWLDRSTGERINCVEDEGHKILGRETKAHEGTSPRNLTTTTVGDELVLSNSGQSRVFSVSLKDRSSILPGGHLGKSFWYDRTGGGFITSDYFYKDYPEWAAHWNARRLADEYADRKWTLLKHRSSYLRGAMDDRATEAGNKYLGKTFPHPLPEKGTKEFYSTLRYTPFGDELTLSFALDLLEAEALGRGPYPDMLCVSFSSTDYIGHAFGPFSLELEDQVLRVDKLVEALLQKVDGQVGLEHTLIVLASDHGVDAIPEYRASLRLPAGRLRSETIVENLDAKLREIFDCEDSLVRDFLNPSLFFNWETMSKHSLDPAQVEAEAARILQGMEGIDAAVTRTDLLAGNLPDTMIMNRVRASFHPERSGEIHLVQAPFWYLYPDARPNTATHGSPHLYDAHVPLLMAGPKIPQGAVYQKVRPADMAATVATLLGIQPPAGSRGENLPGIFCK